MPLHCAPVLLWVRPRAMRIKLCTAAELVMAHGANTEPHISNTSLCQGMLRTDWQQQNCPDYWSGAYSAADTGHYHNQVSGGQGSGAPPVAAV